MNNKIFGLGCLGIIVVGAIVIGGWLMSSYNTLVTKQEKAKTEWSNIDVILKRNQQELNSLVKILKSAKKMNQEAVENMVAARAKATQTVVDPTNCTPEQMAAWSAAQGELERAMGRLMVIHEADYPELKGNEHFTKVMDQLEGSVNRLGEVRRKYNQAVEEYMKQSRTFPTVVIASLFGFGPMYRYEAPANTEAETTDFSELDEL